MNDRNSPLKCWSESSKYTSFRQKGKKVNTSNIKVTFTMWNVVHDSQFITFDEMCAKNVFMNGSHIYPKMYSTRITVFYRLCKRLCGF